MSKHPVLSEKYVRVTKLAYSIGLAITIVTACGLVLLPFIIRLPIGAAILRCVGFNVILCVLFAFRLISLNEHEAIYRAITKHTENKKD